MLNRRLLRIKIFQALYSYYQSDSEDMSPAMKNLIKSLDKMHELFILNLSLLMKIADMIDERFETGKQKHIKTGRDSEQLKRLSDNAAIVNLRKNQSLASLISEYKIQWGGDNDLIRKISRTIEENPDYQNFRDTSDTDSDLQFIKSLYKNHIYGNELLLSWLDEQNIHWAQDQYYIGIILMSYLKKESFFSDSTLDVPGVYKPLEHEEAESDEDFVKILFRESIRQAGDNERIINQYLENWEPDRIALSDIIIMRMACAEILSFDQIPVKVSLNEYIEMSKTFSTPKSKIFVNGVLDKVISHYNREGRIEKTGRGLKEN
jgi:transcription antitermination protein NusB